MSDDTVPGRGQNGRDERLPHYVDAAPFNPAADTLVTAEREAYFMASQWRMMWWKFRRHRLAVVSAVILILAYFSILITEVLAPYALDTRNTQVIYAPPQQIRLMHEGELIGPYVYGWKSELNLTTFQREYAPDTTQVYRLRFFCSGDPYEFWGLFEADFHIVCAPDDGYFYPLGTDRLGRDMLSRLLYGSRVSLTIGLVGIAISFTLGICIGGLAGYYGGMTDNVVQRIIEIIRSMPVLPLWLALSAAVPVTWSPIAVYFAITMILGLIDWTGLARAVRSKLLALREEDYCVAAQLMGASPPRVIFRHLIPNFISHLIASASLSIPAMILGETALSFLGLGLRPPVTSWGVLLNEAQNPDVVALYPWLMAPVVPVIITVLAFNYLGDGLRDAADPYK